MKPGMLCHRISGKMLGLARQAKACRELTGTECAFSDQQLGLAA
jgi:hypothetical protein